MSEQPKDNLISVFVDGREVRVAPGTNMVDAASKAGVEIPHYCYHPKLSIAGNCRMCLVEVGTPMVDQATRQPVLEADGRPKINWMPRPVIGCSTTATPGMHVRTTTPAVKDAREAVMEFLLINHPLDCPICDKAGECRLQEQAFEHGRGFSRYGEPKHVKPKRTLIGPRVMLDDERCILCSRCIRFNREIMGQDILGFVDRGSFSTLTCYPGHELSHNYSLNVTDICPVGALTSTDFRFKMRTWFLKETESVCTESSAGVNTLVGSREGKIHRIVPRRNDAVNSCWMSDSGRMRYKSVDVPDRITQCTFKGEKRMAETAAKEAVALLTRHAGAVAVVGSPFASVEEAFLLSRIATLLYAVRVDAVASTGPSDGMLISEDRTPNTRGLLASGLIHSLPTKDLSALEADIQAGKITAVLTHMQDIAAAGISEESLKKVEIVALSQVATPTTAAAAIVMPSLSVFERSGSFVNRQFRIQRFQQAVPGPVGAYPDVHVLSHMLSLLDENHRHVSHARDIWGEIAAAIPALAGLDFDKIGFQGRVIDGSAWAALPFPDTSALRIQPLKA